MSNKLTHIERSRNTAHSHTAFKPLRFLAKTFALYSELQHLIRTVRHVRLQDCVLVHLWRRLLQRQVVMSGLFVVWTSGTTLTKRSHANTPNPALGCFILNGANFSPKGYASALRSSTTPTPRIGLWFGSSQQCTRGTKRVPADSSFCQFDSRQVSTPEIRQLYRRSRSGEEHSKSAAAVLGINLPTTLAASASYLLRLTSVPASRAKSVFPKVSATVQNW